MLFIEDTAYFVPEHRVNIEDFAAAIGIDKAQARVYSKIYGLEKIPIAHDMSLVELIKRPIQQLIHKSSFDKTKIKIIIHAHTSHLMAPFGESVIRQVQRELGFDDALTFGISMNKCVSTLSAFEMADYLLADCPVDMQALIVACDIAFTPALRFVPNTSVVGDAAAVAVVSRQGKQNKLLSLVANTYGEFSKGIWLSSAELVNFEKDYLQMLAGTIYAALIKANICINDLKFILPHNVNLPSWEKAARYMEIPFNKVYLKNVKNFAHCFGADALINHAAIQQDQLLKPGDYFLMATVGLGATFAAAVFQY
jgi:3-oxoacyl-[acyl-carrier-protein] synthase-3